MKSWMNYLSIGIGCAFGGMLRFLFEKMWNHLSVFPLGTFRANALGAFIIGLVTGLFLKYKEWNPEIKTVITTGFCGGLTTFSTFSFELVKMINTAPGYEIGIYLILTMLMGLFGVFLGLYLILGQQMKTFFDHPHAKKVTHKN